MFSSWSLRAFARPLLTLPRGPPGPHQRRAPRRCSDKSAIVRARALSDLSEVVACFGDLLARDPASDQYRVAERFVAGLVAAAKLQVRAGARYPNMLA